MRVQYHQILKKKIKRSLVSLFLCSVFFWFPGYLFGQQLLPEGNLNLPEGKRINASANREKEKTLDLGGEGGLFNMPAGRRITATATRKKDNALELGGEEGLLSLPEGTRITASASRKEDKDLGGTEGGLLSLPEGRKITVSATRKKKEEEKIKGEILSGRVFSTDNKPVSGAVVSVEIGNETFRGTSSVSGAYQLVISEEVKVPDQLIINADKEGFNTATRIADKQDFRKADITLSRVSEDVIQIDKSLHHLGNNNYGGTINSRFQKPQAEAASYTKDFQIPEARMAADTLAIRAKLKLTVKGAEEENPVFINGKEIGILGSANPDGSATKVEINVDPCTLRPGKNILTMESADSNRNGDIDDFEFANIQLVFDPEGELSLSDRRLSVIASVRVMDRGFDREITEVVSNGQFSIEAKGKGHCETLKDGSIVEVFSRGDGDSQPLKVKLVETGPATSVFRTVSPISAASVGAKPGGKIIVRAGFRGASVSVKKESVRESWTVYRLEVKEGLEGSRPHINVITVSFRRNGNTSEFSQWSYPVSFLENDRTGEITWSIHWSSGIPVRTNEMTLEKPATEELARMAAELRKDSMSKAELRNAIGKVLGPGSKPLYDDWQTHGMEKSTAGGKSPSSAVSSGVSELKKEKEKGGPDSKPHLTKPAAGSAGSGPSDEKKASGEKEPSGTINLSEGSRQLKTGIPVKLGPPSREKECSALAELKERIEKGEKPKLLKRTYRAPNGETFERLEASEGPELKPSGYEEIGSEGFIAFSSAKKALVELISAKGCI